MNLVVNAIAIMVTVRWRVKNILGNACRALHGARGVRFAPLRVWRKGRCYRTGRPDDNNRLAQGFATRTMIWQRLATRVVL